MMRGKAQDQQYVVYIEYNQAQYLSANKALLENGLVIVSKFDNEFNYFIWDQFLLKNKIPEFQLCNSQLLFLIGTLTFIIFKKKLKNGM